MTAPIIQFSVILPVCLMLAMLSGCQRTSPDAAFAEVRSDVAVRLNKNIEWKQRGSSDSAPLITGMLANELGVDDAIQIALLNNRSLQAMYEDLGIAQAELVQAGLPKNPRLDAAIRAPTLPGATGAEVSLAGDFLQILFIPMKKKIAAAQFEVTKARVTASVLRVASRTRRSYYDVQAAQQMLEMRKTALEATDASAYAAERLKAAGNITQLVFERENDQNDESKLNLSRAEISLTESRERLNQLMGLWGPNAAGWKVMARMPDVPETQNALGDFESQVIEKSVALLQSRKEVEALARQRNVKNISGVLPSLESGVTASRDDDTIWRVGPSLSLEIPIFDQGQAVRASARAEIRKALEQHAALAVDIRAQARAIRARLTEARSRALFLKNQILPRRTDIVKLTQQQYSAMQSSIFELLQTKRDQIDAGRQFIEAMRDYWIAQSDIDFMLSGFSESTETSQAGRP